MQTDLRHQLEAVLKYQMIGALLLGYSNLSPYNWSHYYSFEAHATTWELLVLCLEHDAMYGNPRICKISVHNTLKAF